MVLDEDRAFVCSSQVGQTHYYPECIPGLFDRKLTMLQGSGERPMVVLFGWAGAKHKHLDKYAKIYRWEIQTEVLIQIKKILIMIRDLGCDTLQYILPTRFIFRHTDQVD